MNESTGARSTRFRFSLLPPRTTSYPPLPTAALTFPIQTDASTTPPRLQLLPLHSYEVADSRRWPTAESTAGCPAHGPEKAGARLAGGSDWPVDALQVWNQLRTAIDRQGAQGAGELYREQEALSRDTTLRMHTSGTAWQLRQEELTGTLEPGKAADLVLLDQDVTRCPVADISGTGVRMTLVGGRVVREADSASGRAASARLARAAAAGARPAAYAPVHGGGGKGRHHACGH
ncbi:amidohydrolase family protein [Streptomyces sp. NPDC099050]|uniref:amidohydrolase family protein n=1 Tax=Streptomyces sp. NPDC099050 TaxID=3366100 RepID=UPI00382F9EFF